MKKFPHSILVLINFVLIGCIYGDYLGKSVAISENLEHIGKSVKSYGRDRINASLFMEDYYLKTESNTIYRFAVNPTEEFVPGQKIIVILTAQLGKIKGIKWVENPNKKTMLFLSPLVQPLILIFVAFILILSLAFILVKRHALMELFLCMASGVLYAMACLYVFRY